MSAFLLYGLEVTFTCPVCKENLDYVASPFGPHVLSLKGYATAFFDNVCSAAYAHKLCPCDPTVRWTPEQRGYCQ